MSFNVTCNIVGKSLANYMYCFITTALWIKPWHPCDIALCLDENLHYISPAIGTDGASEFTGVITGWAPHFLTPATLMSGFVRPETQFPDKGTVWFNERTSDAGMEIGRLTTRLHWALTGTMNKAAIRQPVSFCINFELIWLHKTLETCVGWNAHSLTESKV